MGIIFFTYLRKAQAQVWMADLVVLDAVGQTDATPELVVEKTSDGQPNDTGEVRHRHK